MPSKALALETIWGPDHESNSYLKRSRSLHFPLSHSQSHFAFGSTRQRTPSHARPPLPPLPQATPRSQRSVRGREPSVVSSRSRSGLQPVDRQPMYSESIIQPNLFDFAPATPHVPVQALEQTLASVKSTVQADHMDLVQQDNVLVEAGELATKLAFYLRWLSSQPAEVLQARRIQEECATIARMLDHFCSAAHDRRSIALATKRLAEQTEALLPQARELEKLLLRVLCDTKPQPDVPARLANPDRKAGFNSLKLKGRVLDVLNGSMTRPRAASTSSSSASASGSSSTSVASRSTSNGSSASSFSSASNHSECALTAFVSPTEETLVSTSRSSSDLHVVKNSLKGFKTMSDYLDKVPSAAPTEKPPPPPPDEVDVNYDDEGCVRAMSLGRIVERICRRSINVDDRFCTMVLWFFRHWTTPLEFAGLLVGFHADHKTLPGGESIATNVTELIAAWTSVAWEVGVDEPALPGLLDFVTECLRSRRDKQLLKLVDKLQNLRVPRYAAPPTRAVTESGTFAQPKSWSVKAFCDMLARATLSVSNTEGLPLHTFSSATLDELVFQLTLREEEAYKRIDPKDVADYFLTRTLANPATKSNLDQHRNFSDRLSEWANKEATARKDDCDGLRWVAAVISLITKCVKLRNFSSAFFLWSGLTRAGVEKWPQWAIPDLGLTNEHLRDWAMLCEIFDGRRFTRCFDIIRAEPKPAIPLVGVYRGELQGLAEGCPKLIPSSKDKERLLINVKIFSRCAAIVCEWRKSRKPYAIKRHDVLQGALCRSLVKVYVNPDDTLQGQRRPRRVPDQVDN